MNMALTAVADPLGCWHSVQVLCGSGTPAGPSRSVPVLVSVSGSAQPCAADLFQLQDLKPCTLEAQREDFMLCAWGSADCATMWLQYEGGGFQSAATDIICPMYARTAQIRAFFEHSGPHSPRPGILCEYAHSMGNSTGGFSEYWSCFEELRGMQARAK